jgi:hypothetical protein
VLEHLVDGVGVEQPLVELGGVDGLGRIEGVAVLVLAPVDLVPVVLLRVRQLVVLDALPDKLERD